MSVFKQRKNEHKREVSDYQFSNFVTGTTDESKIEVVEYKEAPMAEYAEKVKEDSASKVKIEREYESNTEFAISTVVKKYRGMHDQEKKEHSEIVRTEVNQKIAKIKDIWMKKGYEDGRKKGFEEVKEKYQEIYAQSVKKLDDSIRTLIDQKQKFYVESKNEAIILIREIAKWVIMRELHTDDSYLERLLEKSILELKQTENLVLKVNESSFDNMKDVLERISVRIGKIKNARVEIDHDNDMPGLVLESTVGILDASFNTQMAKLNELFDSVAFHE